MRNRAAIIWDAVLSDADELCHLDALERASGDAAGRAGSLYVPVLFSPHEQVTRDDRLRLAFGATILARIQGVQPDSGRIIHGQQFKMSRVGLATLSGTARGAVGQIRAIVDFPAKTRCVMDPEICVM
jgi:hypothetical protein